MLFTDDIEICNPIGSHAKKRKCRTCNCDANQMASFFNEEEFDIRTHEEHVERCATLNLLSERSRTYWSREYGINGRSPLLDIPHFDVSKCLMHDAMHVLFEGVVPFEVKFALKHFTSDKFSVVMYVDNGKPRMRNKQLAKEVMSLDELNCVLRCFPFGHSWKKSIPPLIEKKHLADECNSLKMDSAQIWCLLMHLPLMIGRFVSSDDEHWRNLLRL